MVKECFFLFCFVRGEWVWSNALGGVCGRRWGRYRDGPLDTCAPFHVCAVFFRGHFAEAVGEDRRK